MLNVEETIKTAIKCITAMLITTLLCRTLLTLKDMEKPIPTVSSFSSKIFPSVPSEPDFPAPETSLPPRDI